MWKEENIKEHKHVFFEENQIGPRVEPWCTPDLSFLLQKDALFQEKQLQ